jgi:hypothetical protein
VAGVAFAGVVAGHSLTYVAAIPAAGERGAYLAATGHSHWRNALMVALLMEVLVLTVVAVRGFRDGLRASLPLPFGTRQLAMRLGLIQVATFGALEAGERLVSGAGVSGMFAHRVFVLGVAVQLVVAVAGALLMRWLAAVARAIGACFRADTARRACSPTGLPGGLAAPSLNVACSASRGRAPPAGAS